MSTGARLNKRGPRRGSRLLWNLAYVYLVVAKAKTELPSPQRITEARKALRQTHHTVTDGRRLCSWGRVSSGNFRNLRIGRTRVTRPKVERAVEKSVANHHEVLLYPLVTSQLTGLKPVLFSYVDQIPRANCLRLRPLRAPHFTPIHTFCTRMVRVWYKGYFVPCVPNFGSFHTRGGTHQSSRLR
jgi:hypothetical protein